MFMALDTVMVKQEQYNIANKRKISSVVAGFFHSGRYEFVIENLI